jgi:hypothetical protein
MARKKISQCNHEWRMHTKASAACGGPVWHCELCGEFTSDRPAKVVYRIEFLLNDRGIFRPGNDFVNATSAEEAKSTWELEHSGDTNWWFQSIEEDEE